MNRTALTNAIFSVYASSAADQDQRDYNKQVERILSTLKSAEDEALASPVLAKIDAQKVSVIKENLNAAIEAIDSESFPIIDTRDAYLNTLVPQYLDSVAQFTASGSKGFYDCALTIYVTFDHNLKSISNLLSDLQQSGCDIQIIEQLTHGNPEHDKYRSAGAFSCIYPSSQQGMLSEALDKLSKQASFYMQHYFITPVLYDAPADAVTFAKETIADMRSNDSYDDRSLCLDALASLGLSRTEFSSWIDDNLQRAVKKAISLPDLYRNDRDHVNGMMPTPLCYEEEECQRFGLSFTANMDDLQPRNMRDEMTIFSQMHTSAS